MKRRMFGVCASSTSLCRSIGGASAWGFAELGLCMYVRNDFGSRSCLYGK